MLKEKESKNDLLEQLKERFQKMSVSRKRIFEILDATPEVRKDKIAVLKKAIAEGTYQVKADDIARKLVEELLFELVRTPNNHRYRGCRNKSLPPCPGAHVES